jgi:wobble nucleotide-excising tRNase
MQLRIVAAGYSVWDQASLDALCESTYMKMHREVVEFLDRGVGDTGRIAKNLRPLLEGYLHRRFPISLREGLLLGECLQAIRAATTPDPLVFAEGVSNEIEDINTYAGSFHHDGNPGYVMPIANATEVRGFSQRVLDVIYGKP